MTMAEIRKANKDAGFHFFDRDTMRFFDSRIESRPYRRNGRVFFITSEQFHDYSAGIHGERLYSVREALPSGHVVTVGEFNSATIEEAREAIPR